MSLATAAVDFVSTIFARKEQEEKQYSAGLTGSIALLINYQLDCEEAKAAGAKPPKEPARFELASEMLADSDITKDAMQKKLDLARNRRKWSRIADEHDQRWEAAQALEKEIERFDREEGERHRAALKKLAEMQDQFFFAMQRHGDCLEARDRLRSTVATSQEERDLQTQLCGTDEFSSGMGFMRHTDGLMDRIAKVEAALDPRGYKGDPVFEIRCDEYPATVIVECDKEIAKLKKEAPPNASDRIAKFERRKLVAQGQITLKTTELAALRKQEAEIRRRMTEAQFAAAAKL